MSKVSEGWVVPDELRLKRMVFDKADDLGEIADCPNVSKALLVWTRQNILAVWSGGVDE